MRLTRWRTRAPVAEFMEVVVSLLAAVRQWRAVRDSLGQRDPTGGHVVHDPMNPGARRCVRIVDDEGKTFGTGRDIAPPQSGGQIVPTTCVAYRDGGAVGE